VATLKLSLHTTQSYYLASCFREKVVIVMATKIRGSQVTLSWPDKFRIAGSATHYFSHILAALEKSHWL